MNSDHTQQDEDEIDVKNIISLFIKKKMLIILLTLVSVFISFVYSYFLTDLYESSTTIEISNDLSKSLGSNMVFNGLGFSENNSLNTELEVLKSRSLIEKVVNKVDFSTCYYVKDNIKKKELYMNSPISVEMAYGEDKLFSVRPLENDSFLLILKNDGKYKKIHKYGERITGPGFEIVITKKAGQEISDQNYFFIKKSIRSVVSNIQKRLTIVPVSKNSNVIRVSFQDNIPLRAENFLNSLAKVYLDNDIEYKKITATKTLDFVEDQIGHVFKRLEKSELALIDFKKNADFLSVSSENSRLIDKLVELHGGLEELSVEEEVLNSWNKNTLLNEDSFSINSILLYTTNPLLKDLINSFQEVYFKKRALLLELTEEHPEVHFLSAQIKDLEYMISANISDFKEVLTSKKRSIETLIAKYEEELSRLPAIEKEYATLKREMVINEKIYSYLLEKRSEVSIAKGGVVTNNRVIDTALMPDYRCSPKRKEIVIIGAIIGMLLALGVILLIDYLDDSIKDFKNIENDILVPVLGSIPIIYKDQNKVEVLERPRSILAESLRIIKSNIEFILDTSSTKVISVTSTIGREGKTLAAVNLAGIFSFSGKKTIIISLDMRKPSLHNNFNLQNQEGISSVLAGKVALENVILKSGYNNLDIINAGPIPPNPSELINSDMMQSVLNELKSKYDLIVFDTPPVGVVVDAFNIMKDSDLSIYIARVNYSKRECIQHLNKIYKDGKTKNLTFILNGVSIKNSYGYYVEDN